MMNEIYDYIESGFKIFGLHGVDDKGACACGDPSCKALFKHPVLSNWSSVPVWSDEQLETFEMMGHFETGFGLLVSGWLIVDIDARNGGVESFKKLCEKIPEIKQCGFIVNTGSGNGSQHYYFKAPSGVSLRQTHEDFEGIDFKTSGYVVGAGSIHSSGMQYEIERGFTDNITEAPSELVELLKRPEYHRVEHEGQAIDITVETVSGLLSFISPSCGYEPWVKVGMAIHHCLNGDGLDLWDRWSAQGENYCGFEKIKKHWHSFGKSAQPAGYGTLLHFAKDGGYEEPVTFDYNEAEVKEVDETLVKRPAIESQDEIDTSDIDLNRPVGFVGEVCEFINSQCLYPREKLAVAAALSAVGAIAGYRYIDSKDGMSPNTIMFCVAGSGTGKESVQQAYLKLLKLGGVMPAIHGAFKSEQELLRNMIRHQLCGYMIDEVGIILKKLDNATKKGGASYLEGIIGLLLSSYSKPVGFMPISGDLKEDIKSALIKELVSARKALENLPADSSSAQKEAELEREIERIESVLTTVDDGIKDPYLNFIGFTTPVTFDDLMTYEQATNGFLSRAMIFRELEDNPKRRKNFKKQDISEALENKIIKLSTSGYYNSERKARIEHAGDKIPIPTTKEGVLLLDRVYESFFEMAETHKGATGLQAIPRRGYEQVSKISLLLALAEGVRNEHHIRWAYAFVKNDCEEKLKMAYSTIAQEEKVNISQGITARILSMVSKEHGESFGVIANKLRKVPKDKLKQLLAGLIDNKMLVEKETEHPANKTIVKKYFLA